MIAPSRSTPARSTGFSSIELLVVAAIVLVLAVIAFPVFSSIKRSGDAVKCISNLRRIYTFTLAFVDDHNGLLPPDLGTAKHPIEAFQRNAYWWQQQYLGRYLRPDRKTSGVLSEEEKAHFRCPARFVDGPDDQWTENSESVTYLMRKMGTGTSYLPDYRFRTIPDRHQRLLFTEGRWSTLVEANAVTGEFGSRNASQRLRRYHGKGLHIIFMDGHFEAFSGSDEEVAALIHYSIR
ncbi:MAG TPA: hypothetical protein VNQ90_13320 [Chthoniobacteraceae bacterium]|nr:hypothetical protein [Chthoniobacteraceae bacterium]